MASSWKAMSRLSSRLQSPILKLNKTSLAALRSTSQSSATRISLISRLPLELSSVGSMMPLHSAIASARLISSLASESQTWSLVPQGKNPARFSSGRTWKEESGGILAEVLQLALDKGKRFILQLL